MTLTARLNLGDIFIGYIAHRVVRNDYGVPGSPVWYEPEDIEVVSVEILGVEVKFDSLPLDLQNEMLTLADEIDTNEWEEY